MVSSCEPSSISNNDKLEQFWNAACPIVLTPLGITNVPQKPIWPS